MLNKSVMRQGSKAPRDASLYMGEKWKGNYWLWHYTIHTYILGGKFTLSQAFVIVIQTTGLWDHGDMLVRPRDASDALNEKNNPSTAAEPYKQQLFLFFHLGQ